VPAGWDRLRFGTRLTATLAGAIRLPLLRTGIHLGLFEALRTPQTPDALAERLGLAADLVRSWLRACHAQDLLQRRGESYSVGPFVRWLLDAPEASALHATLDQVALAYAPRFDALGELMKGAERPAYGAPDEALRVAAASRLIERRALRALGRIPGVRSARRVLDVGCGHGTYLAGFLSRYRDAHGLGVEIDPEVAEEARRTLREAEVWRRAEVRTGDFRDLELPAGSHDLVLLNNSLHYFPAAERDALFRRVRGRLAPGGVLAVQTPVVSDTPTARALGALANVAAFDLYLRTHHDLHGLPEPAELAEALGAAGFAEVGEVAILPGGTARYVWARAPR
jgi:trans-aconitate methyltransferase